MAPIAAGSRRPGSDYWMSRWLTLPKSRLASAPNPVYREYVIDGTPSEVLLQLSFLEILRCLLVQR